MAKFNEITIRVLNTTSQIVKNVFPSIANNKQLMKNMGFVISDPHYDAKMEAFKNKKTFSENGTTNHPLREAFVVPVETKPEVKVEQTKNIVEAPEIKGEPTKRTRRTKAQIETDKLTASKQVKA